MAVQSLFSWLTGVKNKSRHAGKNPKPARRRRLAVESLEDRLAPALFTVNTLVDENDGIGANNVSLRDAIAAADAVAGADIIEFDPSLAGGSIQLGGTQLPTITDNLTITGLGADQLTIDADGQSRIFEIAASTTVDISGLTLTGGSASEGGGIINNGTLTVTNCTISGNTAIFNGGGIFNFGGGTLTVTNCTIRGNTANFSGGAIFTNGGGNGGGALTLTNCTVTGHTTTSAHGGAIAHHGLPPEPDTFPVTGHTPNRTAP